MTRRELMRVTVLLLAVVAGVASAADSRPVRQLVAVEGKGYLETVDGYRVLHLKGTPEEMGYQHGVLLRDAVRANVGFLLKDDDESAIEFGGLRLSRKAIAQTLAATFANHVPERFTLEMKALARGAGLPEIEVIGTNLIPELMHCSGFALLSKATADGRLYHGRVLDYGVDMHLQDHAVLIIQEPQGGIPFVNVSYAGFIGSVTGMNVEGISIGEMGGGGVGQWNGIPMSFLVRMVLEDTDSLNEAIGVFQNNPRTCEYYYVIADAEEDSAVGMKAIPERLEIIRPGQWHELLPNPVADTVLMSANERYMNLVRLVADGHGAFTAESAIRLMDAPVAMRSNLHDALMVPGDGVLYVANAARDGSPAWRQRYYRFDVRQIMNERPKP